MAVSDPGLKVLQVASSLHDWGGIERYVLYLTNGLRERGHHVAVTLPPGSYLADRVASPVAYLAVRSKYSPTVLSAYLRHFREKRYDVVHTHFSPDFLMPAVAARITHQAKIVMTRHLALPWSSIRVAQYRRLYDRIIGVSDAVAAVLEASGFSRSMIAVAKAGLPPLTSTANRTTVRASLGMEGFCAGFFGRLETEKGVNDLVTASQRLSRASIHVFGQGPLQNLVERSRRPGLHFHGFVSDVADAMSAVDVVVVPSVWAEAFPFSILEAMSLGKAVVATRVGGIPEMVEDGVSGLLTPKNDPHALAAAIERLAGDPDLNLSMGGRAQDIQRDCYSLSAFAERIERVYTG